MKKINILALLFAFTCLFLLKPAFSQKNTYVIVNSNNVSNIADYENAMDKANFDAYRYIKTHRVITFDTGVVIELLSVYELKALNISVDASKGRIYNKLLETNPIYRLGKNGYILAEIKTDNTIK